MLVFRKCLKQVKLESLEKLMNLYQEADPNQRTYHLDQFRHVSILLLGEHGTSTSGDGLKPCRAGVQSGHQPAHLLQSRAHLVPQEDYVHHDLP